MSTVPLPTGAALPASTGRRAGSGRRIASIARAEFTLLRRNPLALFNAFVVPASMAAFLSLPQGDGDPLPGVAGAGANPGVRLLLLVVPFALLSIVYLNGLVALVARREERVLKRLRTGEMSDAEILAGTATAGVGLLWAQSALAVVVAVTVLHLPAPANPLLVVVALAAGTFVVALLAAASAIVTRTVEMAQVTVLPFVLASVAFGLSPVGTFPTPLRLVAEGLPMTRVLELMTLGLTGTTASGAHLGAAATFSAAVVPLLVLAAWGAAAWVVTQRWFRWEPRR